MCFLSTGDSWCANFELSLPPQHVIFTDNRFLIASQVCVVAKQQICKGGLIDQLKIVCISRRVGDVGN